MKSVLFIAAIFFSLSAFSQTAKQPKIEVPRTITITLTEQQMGDLFNLLRVGKDGIFDSDQISAKGAKIISIFADSLSQVFVLQSQKWHPAPPPKKTDSTNKK